jgi:hypothetical protein
MTPTELTVAINAGTIGQVITKGHRTDSEVRLKAAPVTTDFSRGHRHGDPSRLVGVDLPISLTAARSD